MTTTITWARFNQGGYEVSSKGDPRFSALYARMPDGRTIEQWYQCDIKGYAPGGDDWRLGKGKPSLIPYPNQDIQWRLYKSCWELWAIRHLDLMSQLLTNVRDRNGILTDGFATSTINQARALAEILTEWEGD